MFGLPVFMNFPYFLISSFSVFLQSSIFIVNGLCNKL